jgi:hypothetical protein
LGCIDSPKQPQPVVLYLSLDGAPPLVPSEPQNTLWQRTWRWAVT